MIGIDTNILVRYIAQDDRIQSALATSFIEKQCSVSTPGFVGPVVLAELVWVSESLYETGRDEIANIVRRILSTKQLLVQDAEMVWQALRLFENSKADFADCLVMRSALTLGCKSVMTFDKNAAKAGMTLLK